MDVRRVERQFISVAAGLVFMLTLGVGPLFVLAHRGPWEPEELFVPIGIGLAGAFALAILVRAQKLLPGESIFAGRFGLALAVSALAVATALLVADVWALATGRGTSLHARQAAMGHLAVVFFPAYLARVVYLNLTGRLAPPAASDAEDDDADEASDDDDE